jgi:energy-coupling factor transporter ATP-binding protein EcfA2
MPPTELFIGRAKELQELHAALDTPEGQVLLVVGREGSGKSALLRAFHRELIRDERRFSLHYRINLNDSAESTFLRLNGDLFSIPRLTKRRWVFGAPYQPERLKALLKLLPHVGDSAASLAPDDRRPARDRFLDFLHATAGNLQDWQRLVLIFDPGEGVNASLEPDWVSIAPEIPARVTIIFEQRPADRLARSVGLRRARVRRERLCHTRRGVSYGPNRGLPAHTPASGGVAPRASRGHRHRVPRTGCTGERSEYHGWRRRGR